jgi:CheY-like chemotaxis protein/HPt (histidine-containing phosphotransfer) domain-containing protein
MTPEQLGRLFRAFTQADVSTTRRYGGTGLGLVISRRVVEMMGGWIWLESEAGQGTTFHFTLQAEPAEVPPGVVRGPEPRLSGKRLLVVDDNATNRRIVSLMTQGWGMVPRATGSPLEALVWVRAGEPFDLAVLDMQMPELDGLQLAAALRQMKDAAALPIVLLTSLGHLELGEGSDALSAVLTKPVKASHLFETLLGVLSGQTTWQRAGLEGRPVLDPALSQRIPLRILVAEDNAVNQRLALLTLERMGYRGDVAANGWEAVQATERQPYDVILMDVQMPELDGLAATRIIRRRTGQNARPPYILAMTANALREDREACRAAGMDDYLSKPMRVGELQKALERWGLELSQVAEGKSASRPASVFDEATLDELRRMQRKDGRTMLDRLLELFEQGTPRLLDDLKQALARDDLAAAGFAAHSLKGSALGLGAQLVADLAGPLEAAAKTGSLADTGPVLEALDRACAAALDAAGLERARQGSSGAVR